MAYELQDMCFRQLASEWLGARTSSTFFACTLHPADEDCKKLSDNA